MRNPYQRPIYFSMRITMDGFIKIPNAILEDKDLTHTERILYGYILSLSQKEWYCYASNETLGKYVYLHKNRVSSLISNLEKKWHLSIWDIEVKGIKVRCLTPLTKTLRGVNENIKPPLTKTLTNIDKYIKDISKDISIGTKCSVSDLVKAYKSDKLLPQMLKDVSLVQQRAEYKQAKKNRAYKSISGFLQQLKVCITTVRNNDVRWDTELRFRFALNQAMEKERKSMYRNDNTEAEYQSRKKLYLLEQKQNE